jgi:hypothetical protein
VGSSVFGCVFVYFIESSLVLGLSVFGCVFVYIIKSSLVSVQVFLGVFFFGSTSSRVA